MIIYTGCLVTFLRSNLGSLNVIYHISVRSFRITIRVMLTIFITGNSLLHALLSSIQSLYLPYHLWLSIWHILSNIYLLLLGNHVLQSCRFLKKLSRGHQTTGLDFSWWAILITLLNTTSGGWWFAIKPT